jgi:non-lysosomal glucosylceramidase
MGTRTRRSAIKAGRRRFLKTVAVGAGGLALPGASSSGGTRPPAGKGSSEDKSNLPATLSYPRICTGAQLKMVAFPLGGIGSGSLCLGGRGQLRDWEIFNRAHKGNSPQYAFASVWGQSGNGNAVARVLESQIQPPYEGPSGLGFANVPGLPRLESCTFTGEFPLAGIAFQDPDLPAKMTLEAFTPFIPLDADDSGLPVAVLRYRAVNPGTSKVTVSIAFSVENPVGQRQAKGVDFTGAYGRTNDYREGNGIAGLLMRNPFLATKDPLAGSFALSVLGVGTGRLSYLRGWPSARWWEGPLLFWDDFSKDGVLGPEAPVRSSVGALCLQREIPAQGEAEYTFLLSWHFPNRTPKRCGWSPPAGHEDDVIGNFYCTRFSDAWAVAEYVALHLSELEAKTRSFVSAMRQTTMPAAVKDAATANLSTLVSPTSFRTADGMFHGFEGCFDEGGCCFGSCTHVWNYEPATASLFPALSRSFREQQFGFLTTAEGRMDFREILPFGIDYWGFAAADGQMGSIMKLYLDWRLSGDTEWLRRHWPSAKRAIEFAWIPGGWDANRDGVMEGVQHNTYDVEFIGPNPLCGVWYLGALRASEEMARAVGDTESANEYGRLFTSGSQWIDQNLFNGEFYVQKIGSIPKENIAKGLQAGMGTVDTVHPTFQLGEGCLVDQLVGQYFAQIAGLGLLLDAGNVMKTLRSIYKYNYKRTLYKHESVQRVFAVNDEAALVICDYPHGTRPETPFPYYAEVMTGFEYSAAVLMLFMGMTSEGVELIENIRRRYDGEKRNPWDEAECGYHYARAMASWGAILALSGFRYHGADKALTIQPAMPQDQFRSFWSTAEGWGTFSLSTSTAAHGLALKVSHGRLTCRSVSLAGGPQTKAGSTARVSGRMAAHELRSGRNEARFIFPDDLIVKEGEELALELG